MSPVLLKLEQYLREALGDTPSARPWKEERRLAFFLRDRYRFFTARILGTPCLLMADPGDREEPPATVRKHVDQVRAKWNGPVVYVRERMAAAHRKRLVGQKIPFVVPGNQMYLPILGIDFREHFRKPPPKVRRLRPSSQAVLIHALLQDADDLRPTALAAKLGYSAMAMSQTLDELEAAGVGESTATGRGSDRRLRLIGSKREAWTKAEPLLRTPVKGLHTILRRRQDRLPGPQAGLSALAHYSMLSEPENPTIALSREGWNLLRQRDGVKAAMQDAPGATTVEVWGYAPALFAGDGCVDRLSLYLSLRGLQDERVQAALEQMMGQVPW